MTLENDSCSYFIWMLIWQLFYMDLAHYIDYFYCVLFVSHVAYDVRFWTEEDAVGLFAKGVLCTVLELVKAVLLDEIDCKLRFTFTFYYNTGVTYNAFDNFLTRNIRVIIPNFISFFWLFTNNFNKTACLINSNNFILIL